MKDKNLRIKIIATVLLLALLFVSLGYSKKASTYEAHAEQITWLENHEKNAKNLMIVSAGASITLSAVTANCGDQLAAKFADITGYFGIALGALLLEKYLLVLLELLSFKILIPAACVLGIISIWVSVRNLKQFATKIILIALSLYLVVPISINVSRIIETTFIQSINSENISAIQEIVVEEDKVEQIIENNESAQDDTTSEESDDNWWNNFISRAGTTVEKTLDSAKSTIKIVTSSVANKINEAKDKFEKAISDMFEQLAISIITSCVIPILVMILLLWIVKIVLGLNYDPKELLFKGRKSVTSVIPNISNQTKDSNTDLQNND